MHRLALEFICVFGMPPVDFVRTAASLGVSRIGLAPAPITGNPHGYEPWDLRQDPSMVQATRQALREHGVQVSLAEGFLILPGAEIAESRSALDIMAELGAPLVNCVVIEQDRARAADQFTILAGLAAERGMAASVEFMPLMWPATVFEALDFVVSTGADNARILLDSMHFYRSGAGTGDLPRIDPARIGYVQICDVPMTGRATPPSPAEMQAYGEEARDERLAPGEGELPLAEFLAALPRNLTVGLEAPMLSRAQAGIAPADALRPAVEQARKLLARLD